MSAQRRGGKERMSKSEASVLTGQFLSLESTVKSILIGATVPRGGAVAEVYASEADVSKYINQGVGGLWALGGDAERVTRVVDKVEKKGRPFDATPVVADLCAPGGAWLDGLRGKMGAVTLFSDGLSEVWVGKAEASAFLANVAALLEPGGVFCGYTVDSASVWYKAQISSVVAVADFSSPLFRVQFADNNEMATYGATATLRLAAAPPRPFTLVHFATLIDLAAEHGLYVVDIQNAASFYDDHHIHYPEIVAAFEVFARLPSIPRHVRDLLALFTTFVFRKA